MSLFRFGGGSETVHVAFPAGTVSLYPDLPTPTGSGKIYFVENPKNNFWVKNGRGFYEDTISGDGYINATLKVQASMDSGTVINWTSWTAYIAASNGIGIGDRVIFNNIQYTNLTGTETATNPTLDNTNWESSDIFDTNKPKPTYQEGKVFYDGNKKALSYYNDESDITVNIGQEVLFRIENQTGATIPNGTVIYPDGTTIIGLADAHAKEKSRIIAVTTHEMLNGEMGYATRLGQVGGLDTSLYSPGQIIYLGTNGQFTDVTPNDGGYAIIVGVVDTVDALEGVITVDPQLTELTVEVTDTNGFPPDQRAGTQLLVDQGSRTFTIAPTGSDFHYYVLGEKFEQLTSKSVVFADLEGNHWIYFDGTDLKTIFNPTIDQRLEVILNFAFVSYFYWNAVDKKVEFDLFDERHGIGMSPTTHVYLHITRGAQYGSGIAVGDVIVNGDGNLDSSAQFSVSSGIFYDEDLPHPTSQFNVGETMDVAYLLGSGLSRTGTKTGFAMLTAGTGRVAYNLNTGGVWSVEEVPENDFVLVHLFAINGDNKQLLSIMGQNFYTTAGNARAGASTEIASIVSTFEAEEQIPIATFIVQTRNSYGNGVKGRFRDDGDGNNFVDWRTSELASGANPSSHSNLTNVDNNATGIIQGHVDNTKPFQLPELTTVARDLFVPNAGMKIWNTTVGAEQTYNGVSWV